MDYDKWEDEGGSGEEEDSFFLDDEPYCLCGLPCDDCPDDCEECDCEEQYGTEFDF